MSWLNLNESFNSLKGQISNFATEVLSEGPSQESGDDAANTETTLLQLQEKCKNQELEIAALKKLSDELQTSLQSERLSKQNGVNEEETSWYWDPPAQTKSDQHNQQYQIQVRSLQEEEISTLNRDTVDIRPDTDEVHRLREENKNLTANLEDLDSQHQLAMNRLLGLKTELQQSFETLKKDHMELKSVNEEYAEEIKILQEKISERTQKIEENKGIRSDFDTLHHKYQNLEKIYALLRENAEKFQEENQDLHEEVFKLQEHVSKLEHDLEVMTKNSEVQNIVSKDVYDNVLKELNDFKDRRNANQYHLNEVNIDDNAKSVIENLKQDINDLRHQLNQKEDSQLDAEHKHVRLDKIMQLYNKYVDFEIPLDFVGEIPSVGDSLVTYKLESVFKTVNAFKRDLDSLESQISDKNHNINQLQDQIDELTTENDFLTTDIQHFEKELNSMKKNNDFLIAELTSLKNTSKLEPIIETNHEDNLAKLETELADCTKENKNFESEIKRIEKELTEVKNEKSNLQESLSDLKNKYTAMLSEIDMCKNKTEAAEKLEKTVSQQESETSKSDNNHIDHLKKNLAALNSKNEQLSIDKHIIENDKLLLTQQVHNLQNIIEEKDNAHKELEVLKLALDNKLRDFETKLDEVILHKNDLEIEKSQLENNLLSLKSTINTDDTGKELLELQAENTNLTDILTKTKAEILSIQAENNALKDEIATYQQNANVTQIHRNNQTEYNQETKQNQTELCQVSKNSQTDTNKEVESLKANLVEVNEKNIKLETELSNTDNKIITLEKEFDKLFNDIDEKDELIDALNITIDKNKLSIQKINQTVANLTATIQEKDKKIDDLKLHTESLTQQFAERSKLVEDELSSVKNITREVSEQSEILKQQLAYKDVEITQLNANLHEMKTIIENKDKEIKELNQSLIEIKDRNKTPENVHQNDDYANLVLEKKVVEKDLIKLKDLISTHDKVISELKNNITMKDNAISENRNTISLQENTIIELETKIKSTVTDLQASVKDLEELKLVCTTNKDTAENEKAELLKYLNLKHNESVQYHAEIQRLNQVLQERESAYKAVEEQVRSNNDSCTTCVNLRTTLKEKDSIIKTLNLNSSELERLKVELVNASDVVKNLTEKCDAVDGQLTAQLEVVKKLTAEKAQLSEQEENSAKELERLRRHLVETEESYTTELMTMEQKLTECQARLHGVEERARQTSTVYTSNSIRANQEVETLRNQIKLLEKQREEVQGRRSEAEDARGRSEAALANLQIVLEQFQMEKEREIEAATEKIRNKMDDMKRENSTLLEEIGRLTAKLEESNAGLQAARRLGDQLETRTGQMNDLKEQVKTLQQSVTAAEERYYNAISNQQDKVDKNLVKNLVINYVMTANNSKTQVLRILSSVLDFNQPECAQLGLLRGPAPASLAAEFVSFLHAESTPRPSQTRTSTTEPPPTSPAEAPPSHRRNPSTASTGSNNLLFTNIDNVETSSQLSRDSVELRHTLDTGVNQTRNNEGAILKHVLRDM